MRIASDLERPEVEEIVESIQRFMYLDLEDSGDEAWDPEKTWNCGDVCQHIAGLLDDHGLVPDKRQPADARRFVLYDFDAGDLATKNVYAEYQQAADDAARLDNVIVLKLAVPAIEENL